jgi:hypothetical protein
MAVRELLSVGMLGIFGRPRRRPSRDIAGERAQSGTGIVLFLEDFYIPRPCLVESTDATSIT